MHVQPKKKGSEVALAKMYRKQTLKQVYDHVPNILIALAFQDFSNR